MTEMAGARVMEPQGESGMVTWKVAEEEERGAMDERGRGTCRRSYSFAGVAHTVGLGKRWQTASLKTVDGGVLLAVLWFG